MCGRFTLRSSREVLREEFDLDELPEELAPRYNVAPTQPVAIVPNRVPRRLGLVRWGLVPYWAKDPSIGNREINARAETLLEKPSFRESFLHRRCLVPADGFYEWTGEGRLRTPVYVRLQTDRPFAFAGLWSRWKSPAGEKVGSCAIVTTEPNDLLRPIHDRMPVILPREAYDSWLKPEPVDPGELQKLLVPFPSELLELHPVSKYVNAPGNEGPECIEPSPNPPPPSEG